MTETSSQTLSSQVATSGVGGMNRRARQNSKRSRGSKWELSPFRPLPPDRSLVPYSPSMLLKATPILRAEAAIRSYDDQYCRKLDRLHGGMRRTLYETMSELYGAIFFLQSNNSVAAFLAAKGITRHHNTDNPFQPVVKAFVGSCHPDVRDRLCKRAEVLAVALHHQKKPEEFLAWLKKTTVTRGVEQYKAEKQAFLESVEPHDVVAEEERKLRREADEISVFIDERTAWNEAVPATVGRKGTRRLGLIELALDGSGRYRLHQILPHEHQTVMRLLLASARKLKQARRVRQ